MGEDNAEAYRPVIDEIFDVYESDGDWRKALRTYQEKILAPVTASPSPLQEREITYLRSMFANALLRNTSQSRGEMLFWEMVNSGLDPSYHVTYSEARSDGDSELKDSKWHTLQRMSRKLSGLETNEEE